MLTFSIDLAVKTSRPHNVKEMRQNASQNYIIFRITEGFDPAMVCYGFFSSSLNLAFSFMVSYEIVLHFIPTQTYSFCQPIKSIFAPTKN